MGPLEASLKEKITNALEPVLLEIINKSHLHRGHGGVQDFKDKMGENYSGPIESHFEIRIISAKFASLGRLARQRLVLEIISEEMKIIHAMSIKALAPNEAS